MYIIIDGIDGTGKSQFCREVVEMIRQEYPDRPVELRVEPSDGAIGTFIRDLFTGKHGDTLPDYKAMTLLFQAERETTADQLRRAAAGDVVVVSDRSYFSTWAYQGVAERMALGCSYSPFVSLHATNPSGVKPHLSIVLDAPVRVALSRKRRNTDLFEKEEYLERVREVYLAIRGSSEESIVKHVDTNRDIETVRADIFAAVREAFSNVGKRKAQ